jgi:hypothetical protein
MFCFILMEQNRLVVPEAFIPRVLQAFHGSIYSGHLGAEKTRQKISRSFYWKSLPQDVSSYVKSCLSCQISKPSNLRRQGFMASRVVPIAVFESFSVDALGVLPTDEDTKACHIWIAVDDLSCYVICDPTRQITSESLAKFLIQHIFLVHGIPKILHLDNATNNRSNLITDLLKYWNITPIYGSPHHHAAQAHVERSIRSVTEILRSYVNASPNKWSNYLQAAVFSMNTSVHSSTMEIPYFLAFGRMPVLPADLEFNPEAHHSTHVSDFL